MDDIINWTVVVLCTCFNKKKLKRLAPNRLDDRSDRGVKVDWRASGKLTQTTSNLTFAVEGKQALSGGLGAARASFKLQ